MKKVIIIVVILLLLAGAGGGAYYYFFMMNTDEELIADEAPEIVINEDESATNDVVVKETLKVGADYYVLSDRLNVRSYPENDSLIRSVLRKGDKVVSQEVKGEWVRISGYMVHDSGRDVADWVHLDYLSTTKPVITAEEKQKTFAALIKKSDDMLTHQAQFIIATEKLIDDGQCTFEDFELVGGWIRSINYKTEPVY